MPEDTTTPDPKVSDDGKKFTQAELDTIVEARLARESKKHSDYDELKAKAAKLDELEAANKTDLDKANARADAAEKKVAEAEAKTMRLEVAAEKGVKARWLSGSTREELEAAADEYLTDHPTPGGGGGGQQNGRAPGKPAENLRGGGDPTNEGNVETDPAKLAGSVPRL